MSKMASAKLSDDSSAALGVDTEEGREGAEEGGVRGRCWRVFPAVPRTAQRLSSQALVEMGRV